MFDFRARFGIVVMFSPFYSLSFKSFGCLLKLSECRYSFWVGYLQPLKVIFEDFDTARSSD